MNGSVVILSQNTTFSEVANYTCDPGYMISSGNETRVCGEDSLWTGLEPICSRKGSHFEVYLVH